MPSPRTRTICVINKLPSDKSSRDRISGILRFCSAMPAWNLRIVSTHSVSSVIKSIRKCSPDGILCVAIADTRALKTFRHVPVVAIDADKTDSDHTHVLIDDAAVIRPCFDLLVKRQYKHLAYVGTLDSEHLSHSLKRAAEFRACAERLGIPVLNMDIKIDPRILSGSTALVKWIKSLPKPCGVATYSDAVSRIVLDSARQAGLIVPDQIAICGIDNDSSVCESMRPALTSTLPDFEQSGYLAADLLNRRMNGEALPSRVFTYGPHRLIERESTQDTRNSGRMASFAQQYILDHGLTQMRISDIAQELHISPRRLETAFRQVIGCSMRTCLTALRVDKAKDLLVTTGYSLDRIARECGCDRFASFALLFKRQTKMTMSEYRKNARHLT